MESRNDGPQRSDAQRNRERILEVALAELSRAVDVPLSLIAKKAGVGQGTFYRNFPSKNDLVLAFLAVTFAYQALTRVLWLYEARVHGGINLRGPRLPYSLGPSRLSPASRCGAFSSIRRITS